MRSDASPDGGGRRVDVGALPELEHHECPEPMTVVGGVAVVLVEQALHSVCAEPATRGCPIAEEELASQGAQLLSEPRGQRPAEAGLPALGDDRREIFCERATKRDLAEAASSFQMVRQREPELDDAMVEKR